MMTENIRKSLDFLRKSYDASPWFERNPGDGLYRWEHSLRVAHIGAEIARGEGLDEEKLTIACILHDIAYSREIPAGGWNDHGRVGAAIARPFLESLGMASEDVNEICYGIAIHVDDVADFEGQRTALALSVGDADNIDRFGTFRIFDSMRHTGFYEMSLEEKLDWAKNRIPALNRLRSIDFATKTAESMWLANLDYQTEFFTRLLRQLEESRIPEEF